MDTPMMSSSATAKPKNVKFTEDEIESMRHRRSQGDKWKKIQADFPQRSVDSLKSKFWRSKKENCNEAGSSTDSGFIEAGSENGNRPTIVAAHESEDAAETETLPESDDHLADEEALKERFRAEKKGKIIKKYFDNQNLLNDEVQNAGDTMKWQEGQIKRQKDQIQDLEHEIFLLKSQAREQKHEYLNLEQKLANLEHKKKS